MKILFDQGTPVPLRNFLSAHTVVTAYEKGWSSFKNGQLIIAAEADEFDCLVTTDQNLKSQQNLSRRKLAIVVLSSTSWPKIRLQSHMIAGLIDTLKPGAFLEISI